MEHCIKSVHIRSFSGPFFLPFEQKTSTTDNSPTVKMLGCQNLLAVFFSCKTSQFKHFSFDQEQLLSTKAQCGDFCCNYQVEIALNQSKTILGSSQTKQFKSEIWSLRQLLANFFNGQMERGILPHCYFSVTYVTPPSLIEAVSQQTFG